MILLFLRSIRSFEALTFAGCCLAAQGLASAAEPEVAAADLPRTRPVAPASALSTLEIRPGVRAELVASEPLVVDPIAMCFDEDSRLFVVEMRDYSEHREDRLGRIRMLEDTNGDGRMDKSTIFAENLPWPTALIWYNGGLFVGSTPDILYLKDTDGDGKADDSKVIFTGFGAGVKRLNVQQLLNSFTWGLDNRIHGASGGNGGTIQSVVKPGTPPLALGSSDFSFDPRTFEIRRENGGGQYGMSFDNAGRKFICNNSAHIRQVMYAHGDVLPDMQYPLPSPVLDIPVDGPSGPVYRISPDEPWRVLRTKWRIAGLVPGPVEGGGRSSGYFTSATGVTIYRGTALGPDFEGDAFIADVGSNLVHRKKLRTNGVPFVAERADDEQKSEFLASRDLWFRPVSFANAPDGALYIADMYREVIEHPWSLPPNIKKHLNLNSGNDRGRIYRIVSTNFTQPTLPKLSTASNEDLVALLAHPNGWHRDTASRLLYERTVSPFDEANINNPPVNAVTRTIVSAVRELLRSDWEHAQIHALGALQGMDILYSGVYSISRRDLQTALTSRYPAVREVAMRYLHLHRQPATVLDSLAADPSPRVRYRLAWALAPQAQSLDAEFFRTFLQNANDPWEKHAIYAVLSRVPAMKESFPEAFRKAPSVAKKESLPTPKATPATSVSRAEAWNQFSPALTLTGNANKGRTIYQERCASCHRLNNEGTAVGPDLESVRTAGKETTLINILDPNREVPPRFATVEVSTTDDEIVSGVVANDAANGLTLKLANGVESFIPRTKIKSTRTTSISLMPEGLESGLTPADLADLLAYIAGE